MNTENTHGRSRWNLLCIICLFALTIATTAVGKNTITNLTQLAQEAFRVDRCFSLPWTPWQWRAYSTDGGDPWWLDCSQLPCTGLLPAPTNLQAHGVQLVSVLLTKNVLTGETTLQPDGSTDVVVRVPAPSGYQPGALSEDRGVWSMWQQVTNCPVDCWGIEGEIPAPTVELHVLLADAADLPAYQNNLLAEEAAQEAAAAMTASEQTGATFAGGSFAAMAEDMGSGMMMSMDSQQPCTDTNITLAITSITADTNGCITISWSPTCTNFIYGVFITEELSDGVWTNRAALWGNPNDTTTSWTDATTANVDHRFYKVVGLLPSASSDWDGDGMPDLWEMQYGLNPFDPGDAHTCIVCDGTDNLTKYLLGRDPTKAAVSDTSGVVNLNVFTPLE